MMRAVEDLIKELEQLRGPVDVAFQPTDWDDTRLKQIDLGRRRDTEMLGRRWGRFRLRAQRARAAHAKGSHDG
jgi:hypothetical protein